MNALSLHKDRQLKYRRHLIKHITLLRCFHPMSFELKSLMTKDDLFEKPNQALFIHLSRYFVTIVDLERSSVLTWPLYDKKAEHTYRVQIVNFVSVYFKDKLVSPLLPSHLVNTASSRVTKLMFELSRLAIRSTLHSEVDLNKSEFPIEIWEGIKTRLKEDLKKVSHTIKVRLRNKTMQWLNFKSKVQIVSDEYIARIPEIQFLAEKNMSLLNNLVNNFNSKYNMFFQLNTGIQTLKDADDSFLEAWCQRLDKELLTAEKKWAECNGIVNVAKNCKILSVSVVMRLNLKDQSAYTIEYCPEKDSFPTQDIENHVTSEQRYIFKNIVVNDRLSFPNLLRAYALSASYLFKNVVFSNDICQFNEMLGENRQFYDEALSSLMDVLTRMQMVQNTVNLEISQHCNISLLSMEHDLSDIGVVMIHPMPDLTFKEPAINIAVHKSFTPLNTNRLQFGISRNFAASEFAQPRSIATNFQGNSRDRFLKNMANCRIQVQNATLNCGDLCNTSQLVNMDARQVDDSIGFTKQQITRLLSTRKSSSSKKKSFAKINQSQRVHTKRGSLFGDAEKSLNLYKCNSSPNLFETRSAEVNKRYLLPSYTPRHLAAILQEDSPKSLINLSGLSPIEADKSMANRPIGPSVKHHCNIKSVPDTNKSIECLDKHKHESLDLQHANLDSGMGSMVDCAVSSKNAGISGPINALREKSSILTNEMLTPKLNISKKDARKSNSIERIIEKYKRVRISTLVKSAEIESPSFSKEADFNNIAEEKENNFNQINLQVNAESATRLPDICMFNGEILSGEGNFLDPFTCFDMESVKKRESLGTALGVDKTILDQFELID